MIPPTLSIHEKNMNRMMNTNHHHHHGHHGHHHHHPNYYHHDDDTTQSSLMNNNKMIINSHNDNNNNNNDEQQQQLVKCTLDDDQCLNLANILQSFQTAINEEQAWALCYQIVKCFRQYYQPPVNSSKTSHHNHHHHNHHHDCYLITDPSHVHIHKDGFIHRKTLDPKTFNGMSLFVCVFFRNFITFNFFAERQTDRERERNMNFIFFFSFKILKYV